MTLARSDHLACMPRKRCSSNATSTRPASAQEINSAASAKPSQDPSRHRAMWITGNHEPIAGKPKRIGEKCFRQPVTEAVSVSPALARPISSGKALA